MAEPGAGLVDQLLTAFEALAGFAVATWAAFIFGGHGYIKGRLRENPALRKRVACELEEPKRSAPYLRLLDSALSRLDEILGPINFWPGAFQGFGFCLTLALVYSSAFLILGWALFGASGQIGTLDALPDWDGWWRALFALAVVLYSVMVFYVIRRVVFYRIRRIGAGSGAVALTGAVG